MNRNDWLFPQNSCDMEQFFITLKTFAYLNGISRDDNVQQLLMNEHAKRGKYNPYIEKPHHDLSSANHKIDEPRFYGAIYETPNKKIHVSTYGELLLKYESDLRKRNYIFISMLFSVQFDNPYKKMKSFNIYPLRLIFQLLIDSRINYLSNLEVLSILYKITDIKSVDKYEKIVSSIVRFREFNIEQKIFIINNDTVQNVKNYVSCNYLFNMISEMNITNQNRTSVSFDVKSEVRKKQTKIRERYLKLNDSYKEFVHSLLEELKVTDSVKIISGLRSDWIRDIYNSVPNTLLNSINENDDIYTEYLQIPKLLLETSRNSKKWNRFEELITKGFNLFEDVDAETISGPGQPDTLAHFTKNGTIFCADGKSTNKKISYLNDGRLKQHRNLYNAKYTIVVTPGYLPSVIYDIKSTDTCIITSHCFADLITKYIFKLYKQKSGCSFEIFDKLIKDNLGTDISDKIYTIIDNELGISIDSLQ